MPSNSDCPKIHDRGNLLETKFLTINHVSADFEGFSKDYHVVRFHRRAGIIALDGARVLLVRQWRLLPRALSWELPGGTVDRGEDPMTAAVRECEEETGLRCADLEPLVVYYPGLDNVDNRTHLYVSRNLRKIRPFRPDPAEIMELCWFDVSKALDMVFRHEITDAMSVVGLAAYAARNSLSEWGKSAGASG